MNKNIYFTRDIKGIIMKYDLPHKFKCDILKKTCMSELLFLFRSHNPLLINMYKNPKTYNLSRYIVGII
jgi:hypothetical protein